MPFQNIFPHPPILFITRCDIIFCAADCRKRFTERITAFLNRSPVMRYDKIHSSVCVGASGQKFVNCFCWFKVFRSFFNRIIRGRRCPKCSPLKPYAFFLTVDYAFLIKDIKMPPLSLSIALSGQNFSTLSVRTWVTEHFGIRRRGVIPSAEVLPVTPSRICRMRPCSTSKPCQCPSF